MSKSTAKAAGFFSNTKLVYGILFVFAFLIYVNTLGHQTALDDFAVIETNSFVQKGFGGIPDIFTTFYWKGSPSFATANSGIYRPLSLVVFAADWAFTSGKDVQSHAFSAACLGHWQNVILYAAIIVLLYRVLRRMFHKFPPQLSFIVTLLFAAHPLHTEVVANVKSMDELLAFLFSLLALQSAFNWLEQKTNKQLLLSALWLLLALLSKEGALLFAVIIPLALYYFTEISRNEIAKVSLVLLSILMIWFGMHTSVIGSDESEKIVYSFNDNTLVLANGFAGRLASAISIFGRYLLLILFPLNLSYDYSYNDNPVTSFADPLVWLTIAVCLGLLFIAVKQFKQRSVISFGILFFFITFALTCNVFFLIGTTMAERLTFVPLLGFCIAAGWLIVKYTGALSAAPLRLHTTSLLAAGLFVLPYTLRTIDRNADWKNNATLMIADAQAETGSARIYYNYGTVVINRVAQNFPEAMRFASADSAIAAFTKTIEIDSTYAQAWFQLGVARYRRNQFNESVAAFYKARSIDAKQDVDLNLADALHISKQYDSAVVVLRRVVERKDASANTRPKLAECLMAQKDTAGAIDVLKTGIARDSMNTANHLFLGNILGMRKEYAASCDVLERVLKIDPENRDVVSALALSLQFMGNKQRIAELEKIYLKK
jgi:protein O-mannosyl-transferase